MTLGRSLFFAFIATLGSPSAQAQEVLKARQVSPIEEYVPAPMDTLPLPANKNNNNASAMPASAPSKPPIPSLPPSRPCTQADVMGIWKWNKVYEFPEGRRIQQFTENPMQYVFYRNNNTMTTSVGKDPIPANDLLRVLDVNPAPDNIWQYVIDSAGFSYVYRNGVAIDTLACFIVVNPTKDFAAGQMLLMPPQGQSVTRLILVLDKVWSYPNQ